MNDRTREHTALWVVVLLVIVLLPLTLTPVLPVVDGYAHAVRYLVLSGTEASTLMMSNYEPAWALLPNIGGDIIGIGLMHLFEPVAAMKIVGAIMILAPVGGLLLMSAALHGRPTFVAFAVGGVIGINHITIWGFTNFLIGFGVAMASVAVWIFLANRPKHQYLFGLVSGPLILLTHGVAFMLWGLILAGIELGRKLSGSKSAWQALPSTIAPMGRLLSLALLPVFIWTRMGTKGAEAGLLAGTMENLSQHSQAGTLWSRLWSEAVERFQVILRVGETGWATGDFLLGGLLWGTLCCALVMGWGKLHPLMRPVVSIMFILLIVTPPSLFGVGYIADRFPLVLLCMIGAGIDMSSAAEKFASAKHYLKSALGLVVLLDLGLTTAAWYQQGQTYRGYLAAIRALDAEGTAFPAYLDDLGRRGGHDATACKPLAPLLTLTGLAAVPTFSNPTQQPLRLAGQLAANERRRRSSVPGTDQSIVGLFGDGYDFVIVCQGRGAVPDLGREVMASGTGWSLIR